MNNRVLSLTEAEVREVVRMLAEALTPDDGRVNKVGRVMDALAQRVGADAWLYFRSRVERQDRPPINIDFLHSKSFTAEQMAVIGERGLEVNGEPAEYPELKRRSLANRPFTGPRSALIDDDTWQQPIHRAYVDRMGLDEHLYSLSPRPDPVGRGALTSVLMLFRKVERESFDARAVAITHLLFQELGPLHWMGLDINEADQRAELTPRQRTILLALTEGSSPRDIADHLVLSRHTVNDVIKSLYRHYGVQSRAELMRQFLTVDGEVLF
jgi:DNA-binding CsgD family transcriptional regulator